MMDSLSPQPTPGDNQGTADLRPVDAVHPALRDAEAFGIDLSLIDECLLLTPSERMLRHAAALRTVSVLRRATRATSA